MRHSPCQFDGLGGGVPDEQHVVISVPLWSGTLHCRHHANAASHLLLGRSDGGHSRQGLASDKNRSCQDGCGFSKDCCSNSEPAETYQEAPRPDAERRRCDRLSQAAAEKQSRPVRAGGIEKSRQVEPQGTCSQASQLWQISTIPLPLAPCCVPLPLASCRICDGRISRVVRSRGHWQWPNAVAAVPWVRIPQPFSPSRTLAQTVVALHRASYVGRTRTGFRLDPHEQVGIPAPSCSCLFPH